MSGGNVKLILAPGMVVNANELSVRHSSLAISRDAADNTPETLHVRLVSRMRYGRLNTRWQAPRRRCSWARIPQACLPAQPLTMGAEGQERSFQAALGWIDAAVEPLS
ncbi:hypothetical protein [Nonomuraea sp. NPDC049709]|uniref:hypothetical protein n=1 Tax=Nonomuraea sp. NPDC049709 TaxID=3154736 RepID=UPI00342D5A33